MVKHNNVIPFQHFHKDWDKNVKVWFDQAGRKKRRRLARQSKVCAFLLLFMSNTLELTHL
jgi:large subunit ribosomal protein L13e